MKDDNLLISFSFSLALHLVVIYFFLYGAPSFFKALPTEQVIVFEMLPVSDVSNVPTKQKKQEEIIENEEAKKVAESKTDTPEPPKVEEKKPEEKKVEEKPEENPYEKEAEPIKVEKKVEEKPKEKKTEEKKPEKKPEKKKKIPNKSDLDSLLKNLEKSSKGTSTKSNKQASQAKSDAEKESKGPFNEDLALSISETALLKQQIEKHWQIPIGGENSDKIRIIINITLNIDGAVKQVKVLEKRCAGANLSLCNLFADSAERAVWQASPLENLSPERYDVWKEFNFEFNPSNMMR